MSVLDPKVDQYIADAEDFAKPILSFWRTLVHTHCPEVVEAIKWGIPHFDYKGDFMCVMASYKNHCSFSFIKAELMQAPKLRDSKQLKPIQRYLGKITKMEDLPDQDEFISFLKEAMQLNEQGIKLVMPKSDKPAVLETPDYLNARLDQEPVAKQIFESKSNSFRKEYIIWITDAKTDETRNKRIDEAIGWIAEGKSRFWKSKK